MDTIPGHNIMAHTLKDANPLALSQQLNRKVEALVKENAQLREEAILLRRESDKYWKKITSLSDERDGWKLAFWVALILCVPTMFSLVVLIALS